MPRSLAAKPKTESPMPKAARRELSLPSVTYRLIADLSRNRSEGSRSRRLYAAIPTWSELGLTSVGLQRLRP